MPYHTTIITLFLQLIQFPYFDTQKTQDIKTCIGNIFFQSVFSMSIFLGL